MTSHPASNDGMNKTASHKSELQQNVLTGTGRQASILRRKSFAGLLYPGKIVLHPQSVTSTEVREDKDQHV
ncbi:MAG: hypothetical protein AAGF54_18870 [Pseudomonadota bacterium]